MASQGAPPDKQTIADLLLREMEAHNWSQREMAKACALSNTTISKIARQQSLPDPNTCFKLAQGLGLPVQYVLELAGHEIADARPAPPSLEALLHAQFAHLPEQAIQEMIGATRAIASAYTMPSAHDLEQARHNLEALTFVRRWLDPVRRKALTVVQGGRFLFYQTADLDADGLERGHSALFPLHGDPGAPSADKLKEASEVATTAGAVGPISLSTFPAHHLARDALHDSFCVQLYPFAEFDAHRCQSHPQHAILFTPIYAGDRGSGVRVIYPDGRQVDVRDQVMERVWERIYAARGVPLPGTEPEHAAWDTQLAGLRTRWQHGDTDELWLNPDARTYAAFFAMETIAALGESGAGPHRAPGRRPPSTLGEGVTGEASIADTAYGLLTGPLAEASRPDWRAQSAARMEAVDTTLYGRFETSVVHLQGFCLRLAPRVEHMIPTRHIVPAHRTLIWREQQAHHVLVMHEYLETWLHLRVTVEQEKAGSSGQTRLEVVEDMPLRAEAGRRRIEGQIQELVNRKITFTDSHQGY